MNNKFESTVFILIIISTIVISAWSIVFQLSESDPKIEQKYDIVRKDLNQIKIAVINFYCKNGKFPLSLDDLIHESIKHLPRDPWRNNYIITSLAWRKKGSGIDILSMGGDGKLGGKAWKMDIIIRIDLKEISCEK